MKWENGNCQLSSDLFSTVTWISTGWFATVNRWTDESMVWFSDGHSTEASAKSAVAAWIGKTMAQFSNALAAGEPRIDEE